MGSPSQPGLQNACPIAGDDDDDDDDNHDYDVARKAFYEI